MGPQSQAASKNKPWDLDVVLGRLLHQVGDDLGAVLVVQGRPDRHPVQHLPEGERHPPSDDHLVDLV